MLVRLLNKEYLKSSELYQDFLDDTISKNEEHFEEETISIDEAPDFPMYLFISDDEKRVEQYIEALTVMNSYYLQIPRDIHFNGQFWYSLLLTQKRHYILEKYPEVLSSELKFKNVILKKFDWENYIYKCVLAAQYIGDNIQESEHTRYYRLVAENMDVFNYIIKYEIFRNDKFLVNILEIIDEKNLSEILKANIKGREDIGKDERYGRRVIFEMNKSYPVIMAPVMEKEELGELFVRYLRKYYKFI